MRVDVVIPALNEETIIGQVVSGFLKQAQVASVVVCDNRSEDRTAECAKEAGATVVFETERGYGAACLRAIAALPSDNNVVVFADGDGSDDPEQLPKLIAPILNNEADLVVASRSLGQAEKGAISPQQQMGNALASFWLKRRFNLAATDLGPFRAIRREDLKKLNMKDRNYGWTVEMQIKAARQNFRYAEIPANYRLRVGQSKVSGTLRGTLGASRKILGLLAYYDLWDRR